MDKNTALNTAFANFSTALELVKTELPFDADLSNYLGQVFIGCAGDRAEIVEELRHSRAGGYGADYLVKVAERAFELLA